jgi:hypothetical protein
LHFGKQGERKVKGVSLEQGLHHSSLMAFNEMHFFEGSILSFSKLFIVCLRETFLPFSQKRRK